MYTSCSNSLNQRWLGEAKDKSEGSGSDDEEDGEEEDAASALLGTILGHFSSIIAEKGLNCKKF